MCDILEEHVELLTSSSWAALELKHHDLSV